MVNLKGSRMQESIYYKFNISCFIISLSLLSGILYTKKDDIDSIYFIEQISRPSNVSIDSIITPFYINVMDMALEVNDNLLKLYGLIVYDKHFILFVLIGILLLGALIGCLLLSYDYDTSKGCDPVKSKIRSIKTVYSYKN